MLERVPIKRSQFAVALDFALDTFAVGKEKACVEAHGGGGRRDRAAEEAQAVVRWGEPKRRGDEGRISDVIHRMIAEDPTLKLEHDTNLNETVLWGLGDLHLRSVLERMATQFNPPEAGKAE